MHRHTLIVFAIASVILTAGCATTQAPGLSIRLSANPSPVFSGSGTILHVDIDNRNDRSIQNVNIKVFDAGTLSGPPCGKHFDRMLAYEFQTIPCELQAPVVTSSRSTEISAAASFSSHFSASQVFEVINEDEYNRRTASGDFRVNPRSYIYRDRYVQVEVEFSDAPPLVLTEDRRYFVYFTITNVGDGFLKDIEPGDFHLKSVSSNDPPEIIKCPSLSTIITPVGRSFPRIACQIDVAPNYFSTRSFANADFLVLFDYEYELRNSLNIGIVK